MPAARNNMSKDVEDLKNASLWQRHRIPLILGGIALTLYLGSILWMVFGRGQLA